MGHDCSSPGIEGQATLEVSSVGGSVNNWSLHSHGRVFAVLTRTSASEARGFYSREL